MHRRYYPFIVSLMISLAFFFAACGGTTTLVTTSTTPIAASTSTPSSLATPTPLPFSAALCAAVLPSGNPATVIGGGAPGANDIPVPAESTVTPITPISGGDLATVGSGLWSRNIVQLCSENTTPAVITAFYTAHMITNGWETATQNKEPYDGSYQEPCLLHGNGICWQKDHAPRYVSLESVIAAGNGLVTYTLRLFYPPATPNCDVNFNASPNFDSFVQVFTWYVPLPPLSRTVPNSASGGQKIDDICSAGSSGLDIASIMDTELPKEGWSIVSESVIPGGVTQIWQHNGKQFHFQVTDPAHWELDFRVPIS